MRNLKKRKKKKLWKTTLSSILLLPFSHNKISAKELGIWNPSWSFLCSQLYLSLWLHSTSGVQEASCLYREKSCTPLPPRSPFLLGWRHHWPRDSEQHFREYRVIDYKGSECPSSPWTPIPVHALGGRAKQTFYLP